MGSSLKLVSAAERVIVVIRTATSLSAGVGDSTVLSIEKLGLFSAVFYDRLTYADPWKRIV